ncbi:hypothetical protein CVT25_000832 [Psilocybe cyanescens]|uniref:Uncharacterized protein n=1 Tax=Psilocybe cyanescens TaxID=93625 RepID=A0A409XSE9_PSICY|nr:hypothetical protein CVT25_000832 [Psilocybe cyanescens]
MHPNSLDSKPSFLTCSIETLLSKRRRLMYAGLQQLTPAVKLFKLGANYRMADYINIDCSVHSLPLESGLRLENRVTIRGESRVVVATSKVPHALYPLAHEMVVDAGNIYIVSPVDSQDRNGATKSLGV